LTEIDENARGEKEIPVCCIISHPISRMTADLKELLAWLFYLDDRRKKRADEKQEVQQIGCWQFGSHPVLIWVINQIKELGLHEHQVNRTKHHKNCEFLSKSRLMSIPTLFLLFQLHFLPESYPSRIIL
jgi:hypothetical protein